MRLTDSPNIFYLPSLIAFVKFWRSPKPSSLLIPTASLGISKTIVRINYPLEVLTELRKAIIFMVMIDYNKRIS